MGIEDEQTNEALLQILEEVDENNDGKISFDEFSNAMINDLESAKVSSSDDTIPFVNIYRNAFFQILPKNENDPLFENEADYMTKEDEMAMPNQETESEDDNGDGDATTT